MMRFTGALCSGLGLLWFGPSFAQELTPKATPQDDPLTEAWFDTVQSIGVLEGLSRQLDTRRPGAVDNLRRNTESPLGDSAARQTRLDELEREIARLRSEFELLNKPSFEPEPRTETGPRAPRVEAPTVGLSDAGREAMLRAARQGTPLESIQPELPPIEVPALPTTNDRFTDFEPTFAGNPSPSGLEANPAAPSTTDVAPAGGSDPAPPPLSPAEQRIAELEAELAALTGARSHMAQDLTQPLGTPTSNGSVDPRASQPLTNPGGPGAIEADPTQPNPSDAPAEDLPTTLVLGPLEPTDSQAAPTAQPTQPAPGASSLPAVNDPAAQRPSNPDVGTLPVADRIERARLEEQARAEAERQALAAAMTVEGYSADPVRQGRAAYFAGDYERAVTLLSREPDQLLAVYWQAKSLEKLNRMSEAMKGYQRVAASEDAGELAERAQFDLEFLQWRWEHNEAFSKLKESLEAKRKP